MKKLFFAFVAILLFSCNNGTDKDKEAVKDSAVTETAQPAEVTPAFTPFMVVIAQQKVKDFARAEAEYFNRDSIRNTFGITHYIIGRDKKDSNQVFVVDKIESVDKAKAFYALPGAKLAMQKAGVTNLPGLTYAQFVHGNTSPVQYLDGVAISHHVKDFANWLQAFEKEGDSLRRANGLIERGIARNFYDSNTVSILFEVSDVDKAKARLSSPDLKKVMTDAGVDSPPTIRWFTLIK
jgi:hypothetical protein